MGWNLPFNYLSVCLSASMFELNIRRYHSCVVRWLKIRLTLLLVINPATQVNSVSVTYVCK